MSLTVPLRPPPSLVLAARTLRVDARTERWYVLRTGLYAVTIFVLQSTVLGVT